MKTGYYARNGIRDRGNLVSIQKSTTNLKRQFLSRA